MRKETTERARGLCLFSGGLDSLLAICVLQAQGVPVEAVVFDSPFFNPEPAKRGAEMLGVRLHVVDFTADIFELVEHPAHGYGAEMNPCIDCHACMITRACAYMEAWGFRFIFTGEVLNQRPMSQNRHSLGVVARTSGYEDVLLRPLSATLLEPTLPEREGWVDRERLMGIQGRGRKVQLELARHFKLAEFPTPAGGCRLTEPNFCRRLKDLRGHEGMQNIQAVTLLRYGRHFRIAEGVKLIVGRHEQDNLVLEAQAADADIVVTAGDIPGPTCLLSGTASEAEQELAASICGRYTSGPVGRPVVVTVRAPVGWRTVEVLPATQEVCERLMV